MKKLQELTKKIEAARKELEDSMETGSFDIYYKKSLELDSLIEEYLDEKDGVETMG